LSRRSFVDFGRNLVFHDDMVIASQPTFGPWRIIDQAPADPICPEFQAAPDRMVVIEQVPFVGDSPDPAGTFVWGFRLDAIQPTFADCFGISECSLGREPGDVLAIPRNELFDPESLDPAEVAEAEVERLAPAAEEVVERPKKTWEEFCAEVAELTGEKQDARE
jgi:hypothetical protein